MSTHIRANTCRRTGMCVSFSPDSTVRRALLWSLSMVRPSGPIQIFSQAASQLENTTIELMKDGLPSTPTISSYIINVLHAGDTVGVDGMLFTKRSLDSLEGEFSGASISVNPDFRPADTLWIDRPRFHPILYIYCPSNTPEKCQVARFSVCARLSMAPSGGYLYY